MSPNRHEGPRLWTSGYYYIDIIVGFGRIRKRHRYSLGTKDPRMARVLWERERAKLWDEYYGLASGAPRSPAFLSDLIEPFAHYERDVRKAKTWKSHEQRLRHIQTALGPNVLLSEISSKSIGKLEEYLAGLERPRSKTTMNHYMKLLKTFFNWAEAEGHFPGPNPMRTVKLHVVPNRRRAYTDDEVKRIVAAAKKIELECLNNALAPRYAHRIIMFLLLTGMRLGELLNLKWSNIQGDRIVLDRTETKQKREKIIPITQGISKLLESLKGSGSDYVIPVERDKRDQVAVKWLMMKLREYSGIPDFIFHGLRHTAASIMVSEALGRGAGLRDVMTVLGHSQVETTLRYDHSSLERMRRATEALEEKIGK